MNAPSCYVPLRGGAVEVFFRENGPHAYWWFVHELGRITSDEEQQIQAVVDHELRQLRQAWLNQRQKAKPRLIVSSTRGGDAA